MRIPQAILPAGPCRASGIETEQQTSNPKTKESNK